MPERKNLICIPASYEGYLPPGGLHHKCSKCGRPVWVAPSSWLILHDNPEMKILCAPCAIAQMKKDGEFEIEKRLTPAQEDEIQEYLDSR